MRCLLRAVLAAAGGLCPRCGARVRVVRVRNRSGLERYLLCDGCGWRS